MAPDQSGPIEEAAAAVGRVAQREQQAASRRRRVLLALHDLDLLRIVGRDWIRITDTGAELGVLTDAQLDALARRLEDLVDGTGFPDLRPQTGQLGLDFTAVSAPAPLGEGRSVHPQVFR